ncbi:MAG: rod shape-determining protein MreC [Rikenellaceae bacterium]
MFRLFEFVKRVYVLLLFIALEIIAFSYYHKSSIYTNAKIVVAVKSVTGGLQEKMYDVKSFFHLRKENERLNEELNIVKNKLAQLEADTTVLWTEFYDASLLKYSYIPANVVNNTYVKQNNYITIDKGRKDGVGESMSILVGEDVVGYVITSSDNYSVGISLLNTNFKTSGQEINKKYTGAIGWNGVDITKATISEIPKYAEINVGDTIVTTSFSSKFPEGKRIGIVEELTLINATYYNAVIGLFADFTTLDNVSVVNFRDYYEKTELENSIKEDM